MLRSNITHMTDMGPTCSECGQQGLWGYAPVRTSVMRVRPAYRPQCGSCHHSEDILPVPCRALRGGGLCLLPGCGHDIAAIRAAHQQRTDAREWRRGALPQGCDEDESSEWQANLIARREEAHRRSRVERQGGSRGTCWLLPTEEA